MTTITKTARKIRICIKMISTILVILFGFLQFKQILIYMPIRDMVENINPDILRRVTLFIYYLCWVSGCTYDINIQEDAYDPETSRVGLPPMAIILMIAIGGTAVLLLGSSGDDKRFAVALAVFVVLNAVGFRVTQRYVKPIIASSMERYENTHRYFRVVKIKTIYEYILGKWQWFRFLAGALIVLMLNIVCFYTPFRQWVTEYIVYWSPTLGAVVMFNLIPSLVFIVFVSIMEGWIWYKRLGAVISLELMERLESGYTILPIKSSKTSKR